MESILFGGWDTELKGLWYAKYDTGIENTENLEYGYLTKVNTSNSSEADRYNKMYISNQKFRPVSKPYYITWRNISFTNAFSQALMFYKNLEDASTRQNLNTHMMRESELDALYRFSTDELYGNPSITSNSSNKISAGSDGVNGYSFDAQRISQSSTGNITGIYDITGTTSVFIPRIGFAVKNSVTENEILYNEALEEINAIENIEVTTIDEAFDRNCTKYYNWGPNGISNIQAQKDFIRIGENVGNSEVWTRISSAPNSNIGFRIVIANSSSGDKSNYLYDNSNVTNVAREDLPGFYVTTDDMKFIKNVDGQFFDTEGNKTYYSWSEMIAKNWISVQGGVINAGSNIAELKSKTGILKISDSSDIYKIDGDAFGGWRKSVTGGSVLKIEMSDNITEIGPGWYGAFHSCEDLQVLRLSDEMKEVPSRMCEYCFNLVSYNIPKKAKKIGMGAFRQCKKIESIVIPEHVETIESSAFRNCESVRTLDIISQAESLIIKSLGFGTPDADKGLKIKTLVIPSNVKTIDENAFQNCKELETVRIENGIETLSCGVFHGCTSLKNINLPSSITSFGHSNYTSADAGSHRSACGDGIFSHCTSLTKIDLSSLTQIDTIPNYLFYMCDNLSEIVLPENIEIISPYAFFGCVNLKYLELPEVIKSIRTHSFGKSNGDTDELELDILYKGTKEKWDLVNLAYTNSHVLLWYENIKIKVITIDGEVMIYE